MSSGGYKSGAEGKWAPRLEEAEVERGSGEEGLALSEGCGPVCGGGPFSALRPSMVAKELREAADDDDVRWDEFGFRVDEEDGPEQDSRPLLSQPFREDPNHRLKWIAHLEFTHNQGVTADLTWARVEGELGHSERLEAMVEAGVPHSLRRRIWPRLCGATAKRARSNFTYQEAVRGALQEKPSIVKQIEKDLLRTLPSNAAFLRLDSPGVPKLRRILRAMAYLYSEIGYCQGMGIIVGSLLLVLEEEEAFWMMVTLVEDVLPASYFSASLLGLQADQRVLRQLVASYLPEVERALAREEMELSLLSLHWFLTLFSSVLHFRILLRFWDQLLYHGTSVLFKAALALLKGREAELVVAENSADIFNLLSELPGRVSDADAFLKEMEAVAPAVTEALIGSLRKKQLALLMADQGVLINVDTTDDTNLPKQRVHRRKLKRSQSIVGQIFKSGAGGSRGDLTRSRSISGSGAFLDEDDPRNKNIHQTELLVDLKDAVLRVARHFLAVEPGLGADVSLQPDYSADSHSRDHEVYLSGRRKGRRRARALLDFQRQEEDELGFRRNDVVTILSQRDEHCWVGELNGLRGWFPAKFVEVLDERGKDYSAVGDDAVSTAVTDLVRGDFASALKEVLSHGMKTSLMGAGCHPWLFVEEVALREVAKDFQSVYSRLVLCRTFRLDEDGKVLTPEELLYRSVQRVNATHDAARSQMDVKLRSLVCLGLNEAALHLWFELFCSSPDLAAKWYHPWSFVRSPGWVQIKCEVRLLAQFPFSLNVDAELPPLTDAKAHKVAAKLADRSKMASVPEKPLREGVRDMLVKHHLFSWRI